ncbi:hypothetical protein L207DRAFT_229239 [Hyaloscypha variabilis F]|uniref:Uncharacterized protein n=1 Tax=Hyaloscypha variabilis (strain UAMH 11265 / GT02V1 / F) TaxID=1149755 RepID=A0A2J6QVK0_HYAVF|nr:hypothetical protein L207DRAFT_229239 [Hyaloscypha variabilis F]
MLCDRGCRVVCEMDGERRAIESQQLPAHNSPLSLQGAQQWFIWQIAHAQGKSYPCHRHQLLHQLLSPKLCARPEQGKISAASPRPGGLIQGLIGHADLACWHSAGDAAIQTCPNKERTGPTPTSSSTLEQEGLELPRSLVVISTTLPTS